MYISIYTNIYSIEEKGALLRNHRKIKWKTTVDDGNGVVQKGMTRKLSGLKGILLQKFVCLSKGSLNVILPWFNHTKISQYTDFQSNHSWNFICYIYIFFSDTPLRCIDHWKKKRWRRKIFIDYFQSYKIRWGFVSIKV